MPKLKRKVDSGKFNTQLNILVPYRRSNKYKYNSYFQTWIQDLLIQDQDEDSADSRPRPRPRLSSSKTKTKTKTLMSKTKTETQDLQDQYWKFMTGMDCDKQKD